MFGLNTQEANLHLENASRLNITVDKGTDWNFTIDLFNDDEIADITDYKLFCTVFDTVTKKEITKLEWLREDNSVTFFKNREDNVNIKEGKYSYEIMYLDDSNNSKKMFFGSFKINYSFINIIANTIKELFAYIKIDSTIIEIVNKKAPRTLASRISIIFAINNIVNNTIGRRVSRPTILLTTIIRDIKNYSIIDEILLPLISITDAIDEITNQVISTTNQPTISITSTITGA